MSPLVTLNTKFPQQEINEGVKLVWVTVLVGVWVIVGVGAGVLVTVGVGVYDGVTVGVIVLVGVTVGVLDVGVTVGVIEGVTVGVEVKVGVGVCDNVQSTIWNVSQPTPSTIFKINGFNPSNSCGIGSSIVGGIVVSISDNKKQVVSVKSQIKILYGGVPVTLLIWIIFILINTLYTDLITPKNIMEYNYIPKYHQRMCNQVMV